MHGNGYQCLTPASEKGLLTFGDVKSVIQTPTLIGEGFSGQTAPGSEHWADPMSAFQYVVQITRNVVPTVGLVPFPTRGQVVIGWRTSSLF